jgi:hypothetical protein
MNTGMVTQMCRVCGCTDANRCFDGDGDGEICSWVEADLCSFCGDLAADALEAFKAGFESPDGGEPLVKIYSEGLADAFIRAMRKGGV